MTTFTYCHDNTYISTGSDDQQLPVTGEEAVSEASDVDEPANAEGQSCILIYSHSMYHIGHCFVREY